MKNVEISRRRFGQLMAGVAASTMLPFSLRALAAAGSGTAVAATFPGNWEDAYRTILTPILKKEGFDLTVSPAMAQDQLAKVLASPGNPPYDTLLMSPGQMTVAIEKDLIQKIDPSRLKNWNLLDPAFQGEYGPTVTVEVNGIAYNPDLVPRPKGYRDLFENPAYKGLVSWTGFASNTAVMAYTELAKIYGTGPDDMAAVFKLFKEHPEQLTSIVDSTNHQMTLFQQGEIAVFMCSTGNVARLKSLGLNAEFVHPESGSPAAPVNIHLTKGSKNLDAAYAYMDAAISQAAQTALMQPPVEMFPTNKNVALTPVIAAYVTREQLKSLVYPDWAAINKNRDNWIRQFDSLVAG
ncbi:ABC transporter substrate-binding protein [Erwinia rhapontici]|uniref:ABC transporter substrate-binding protein n=1 Tax=Erwinia rhapontici TaxID=55212 RepID=UPI00216A92DC|nr:extracellular solute-binding protein [Erwinia rhapontici]MCS3606123.1 putative spermidine/putrescine transport system substrate-binding protein [Erwinia rhapontici]